MPLVFNEKTMSYELLQSSFESCSFDYYALTVAVTSHSKKKIGIARLTEATFSLHMT